jgi:hypothetical protein
MSLLYTGNTEFDPVYPAFGYSAHSIDGNRAFPRVRVTFKGTLTGDLPTIKTSVRTTREQARITAHNGTAQMILNYYAPQATFRYVSRTRPRGRRYDGVLPDGINSIQIIDRRGASGRLILMAGGLVKYVNNIFYAKKEILTEGPDWEEVGDLYEVTETSTGRIVDAGIDDFRKALRGDFS